MQESRKLDRCKTSVSFLDFDFDSEGSDGYSADGKDPTSVSSHVDCIDGGYKPPANPTLPNIVCLPSVR